MQRCCLNIVNVKTHSPEKGKLKHLSFWVFVVRSSICWKHKMTEQEKIIMGFPPLCCSCKGSVPHTFCWWQQNKYYQLDHCLLFILSYWLLFFHFISVLPTSILKPDPHTLHLIVQHSAGTAFLLHRLGCSVIYSRWSSFFFHYATLELQSSLIILCLCLYDWFLWNSVSAFLGVSVDCWNLNWSGWGRLNCKMTPCAPSLEEPLLWNVKAVITLCYMAKRKWS